MVAKTIRAALTKTVALGKDVLNQLHVTADYQYIWTAHFAGAVALFYAMNEFRRRQ
jgi:hypothetical protein